MQHPRRTLFTLAAVLVAATASAHELQDNRATPVLRDQTHISVTLYISYGDALHMAIAPQSPPPEFWMVYSAMSPDRMQRVLASTQSRLQANTHLYLGHGKGTLAEELGFS